MGWRLGAPGRIRTRDPRFRRPMLYPLSYGRVTFCGVTACGYADGVNACLRCTGGVSEGIRTLDHQGHNLAP